MPFDWEWPKGVCKFCGERLFVESDRCECCAYIEMMCGDEGEAFAEFADDAAVPCAESD